MLGVFYIKISNKQYGCLSDILISRLSDNESHSHRA